MNRLKAYKKSGLITGLVIGILLSILAILTVDHCNFGINPGGYYSPAGICEPIVVIYFPILILFAFALFFGWVGFILPSILLISICTLIGAKAGRSLQRKYDREGMSSLDKCYIYALLIVIFISIIYSIFEVYKERKKEIEYEKQLYNINIDHKINQGANISLSFPSIQ
jgi:hypothetical protein